MRMRMIWRRRGVDGRRWGIRRLTGVALLGILGGLGGCSEVQPVAPYEEPITDPTQLYMRLTVNYPAVNLSTAPGYNTVQLVATPRDALGNPMSGLPAPTFSTPDTTRLQVSPEGLVTALGTGTGMRVQVDLKFGPVSRRYNVLINVRDLPTPPVPVSLSVQPIPPDSAREPLVHGTGLGNFTNLPSEIKGNSHFSLPQPRISDTAGVAITGLQVAYTSLDPDIAALQSSSGRLVLKKGRGRARFVAQTFAYGVTLVDTVTYTVTLPTALVIVAEPGPDGQPMSGPSEVRINPSGYVAWFNRLGDAVDVVFDDPTQVAAPPASVCDFLFSELFGLLSSDFCTAGDVVIPRLMSPAEVGLPDNFTAFMVIFTLQLRQFPVPGTYTYHSVRTGTTGRIIVEPTP